MHIRVYEFWDKVDLVTKECGISKAELARKIKVSRSFFYDRKGDRMFSLGTLAKFCKETNTSADWLLGISSKREL